MSKNKSNSFEASSKMSMTPSKSSACGKAIIVGEHAVVYGAHAVAMPLLQMGMKLELRPHLEEPQSKNYYLKLGGNELSERISGIIPDTFALLGREFFPVTMKGHSNIPIGAGLGSSATLCIAALRSIIDSCGIELDRDQIAQIGNLMERRFHGNPSGLDTAVVAYEECIYFAKDQTINPIQADSSRTKKWNFALIDSKIRASTMTMIKIAEPFFLGIDGDKRLDRFDLAATLVKESLPIFNYGAIAEAMEETGSLLKKAGVVPETIATMLDTCRDLGIRGAKITGAGGGGTILCLLDEDHWLSQYKSLETTFSDYPIFHIQF